MMSNALSSGLKELVDMYFATGWLCLTRSIGNRLLALHNPSSVALLAVKTKRLSQRSTYMLFELLQGGS